ncbi:hypothetical protein [Clostridium cagae]|uniref:hypothetical protein n=1 Tax=Clostridium cagae TaxID=2080751 RepID=UPI001319D7BA|nr:hypothetical protein [Clostridium cagae]
MRKFLLDRKIDIDNKLVRYRGKEIKIQDESENYYGEKSFVYHKLYRDYLNTSQ